MDPKHAVCSSLEPGAVGSKLEHSVALGVSYLSDNGREVRPSQFEYLKDYARLTAHGVYENSVEPMRAKEWRSVLQSDDPDEEAEEEDLMGFYEDLAEDDADEEASLLMGEDEESEEGEPPLKKARTVPDLESACT